MKAGEAITQLLGNYGVKHVFGIPGTHSLELYRGLAGERHGVRHILAHHEQGAGFMADGYARMTGTPGVCFVITGAGVTNMTTAMGEAYSDSVPMLVLSPVNPPDGGAYNRGRLHEITDQSAVTSPLTAFSATARAVDEIPELIARAFAVFSGARPRPVHIGVPLDVLSEEVSETWRPRDVPSPPVVSDRQVERASRAIDAARTPVIIAGGGVRLDPGPVVRLAEAVGCPVITTVAGRGVIPARHPQCAGAQLRAEPVQALLAESDLAVLLGTELAQTDHWNDDLTLPAAQIRVNLDSGCLSAPGRLIALLGDATDAADRMSDAVDPDARHLRLEHTVARCSELRRSLPDSMSDKERRHWQVLEHVERMLGDGETVVFSDMTQIAYTAIDYMPLDRANSWHHPVGFGTLGYALPAAIGGNIARPDRGTMVIVGDAGLQYTMQELPLASELNLNIKLLLWNNERLEQIRDDMSFAGIAPTGVVQRNPEFAMLARSCGWKYAAASRLRELEPKLDWLLSEPGPAMLEIREREMFPESL